MSSAGRCIACSTSSGMLVGPGRARISRPARTVIVVFPSSICRLWMQIVPPNIKLEAVLFPHRCRHLMPDLIFQLGGGRAWQLGDRAGLLLAIGNEPQDPDFTIGVIGIAAAIAAVQRRTDAGHLIFGSRHAGVLDVLYQPVALGIDIGGDMMGDGAGEMADADALVEGDGAEPHRPLLLALVEHLPEPHMVAAVGAFASRLLEGEILTTVEIEQGAYGRIVIGAVEQHGACDFNR